VRLERGENDRRERERRVGNENWTGLMPYIKVLNRSGLFLARFPFISTVRSRVCIPGSILRPTGFLTIQDPLMFGFGP
jgi:hypothetical protein